MEKEIENFKHILGSLHLKNVALTDYRILSDTQVIFLISGGYNYDIIENQLEYLDQIKTIIKNIPNSYIYSLEIDAADDVYYLELRIDNIKSDFDDELKTCKCTNV